MPGGRKRNVSLACEAELRWRASGNGGVDDDGGEEAVNTTVQAEAWAGVSSGRYGSVDGGFRLRTDQPGRQRRTACSTHRSQHRERAAGGGLMS